MSCQSCCRVGGSCPCPAVHCSMANHAAGVWVRCELQSLLEPSSALCGICWAVLGPARAIPRSTCFGCHLCRAKALPRQQCFRLDKAMSLMARR